MAAKDLGSSGAARAALAGNRSLAETVLTGGDDYELLFAVGGPSGGRRLASISARLGVALTRIGRFEGYSGGARVRDDHGHRLDHGGYRHF